MYKKLAPAPRRLSLLSSLIITNSHIYALFGWITTLIGSVLIWLSYTVFLFAFIGYMAGGIFLSIGLLTLLFKVGKDGVRIRRLMKQGATASGTLIRSEDENLENTKKAFELISRLPGNEAIGEISKEDLAAKMLEANANYSQAPRNIKYFFEFQSTSGQKHQVEALVKDSDKAVLEDEETELILYDPANPDRAVVFDSIRNAPKIGMDRQFQPAPMNKLSVLFFSTFGDPDQYWVCGVQL